MEDRQTRLLKLIEQATGQAIYHGHLSDEDVETDDDTAVISALLKLNNAAHRCRATPPSASRR
jgi:hypothetical protein